MHYRNAFPSHSIQSHTPTRSSPSLLALGTPSGAILLYDVSSASITHRLGSGASADADARMGHTTRVTCATFDATGATLYTGSDDKSVRVWNTKTGTLVK